MTMNMESCTSSRFSVKNENLNINNDKDRIRKRSLSNIDNDNDNNNNKIIKQILYIEKLILKKNNYVKKNPLALMIPDNLYREDISLTGPNKCNCDYMTELYELYGQNLEKKIIICTHNNSNSKIVTP